MLPIGADVIVLTFGKKAGVVVAASRDGRYQVRVGTLVVSCRREDLAAPPETRTKRPAGRSTATSTEREVRDRVARQSSRVDLHGLTTEEARSRVLEAIDRALQRGDDQLEIVHGKGAGRLKGALHTLLPEVSAVRSFRLDPANAGVTVAYF